MPDLTGTSAHPVGRALGVGPFTYSTTSVAKVMANVPALATSCEHAIVTRGTEWRAVRMKQRS